MIEFKVITVPKFLDDIIIQEQAKEMAKQNKRISKWHIIDNWRRAAEGNE